MVSQARQVNFSRTVWTTFHWRGMTSSISVARQACGQRTPHRLATDERMDIRAARIGLRNGCGILGGLGFQFLELQLHLVDQLAAAFGGGTVLVVPEFGDHQLEMRHHRLGSRGSGLRFPACRLFSSKRCAQRVDAV
jgi:hypothetical protein